MRKRRDGGGYERPAETGFESKAWLFMRLSGVVLLGLAVFHLYWMHFAIGVDNIDFQTVVGRWSNPLWRIYDFLLLVFALFHGFNGLRYVVDDYVRRPGRRLAVKSIAYFLGFLLISAGAYIIFTFDVGAA
jgi:succinate dehydrogenase / fumarate reductase membrane anchor subunit